MFQPEIGLVPDEQSGRLADGRIECRFSRYIDPSSTYRSIKPAADIDKLVDLSNPFYILNARGPLGTFYVLLQMHEIGRILPFVELFKMNNIV